MRKLLQLTKVLLTAVLIGVGANEAWGETYPYSVGTSVTDGWGAYFSPEYSLTGDGSIDITFTNYRAITANSWENWELMCASTSETAQSASDMTNKIFAMWSSWYDEKAASGANFICSSNYQDDAGTGFATYQNGATVNLKIYREGTTIKVYTTVTKDDTKYYMSFYKTGVSDETVKFYLTQRLSYLTITSEPVIDNTEHAWQQVWTESTAATGWAAYGANVGFETPATSFSPSGNGSRSARFDLASAMSSLTSSDKWKLSMDVAFGNKGNYTNAQDLNIYSSATTLGTSMNSSGWNYEISNPASCFLNLVNTTKQTNTYTVSAGSTSLGTISPTAGTYYTYTVEYDPTTQIASISIGSLLNATLMIPAADAIGTLKGIHILSGRGSGTSYSKGITLYKEVEAGTTLAPTYTVTDAYNNTRTLTLACETAGAAMYWSETEPVGTDYSGWTLYNGTSLTTSEGTIYAVAYANSKYSDVTTITTGAGTTLSLNGATYALPYYDISSGSFFVKVSDDQSSVLGCDGATLAYYTSDPESTTSCTSGNYISGFAPGSTVYVKASADGYAATTTSYTFPARGAEGLSASWVDDFTSGEALTGGDKATWCSIEFQPVTAIGETALSGNFALYPDVTTTRWTSSTDGITPASGYYSGVRNVSSAGFVKIVVDEGTFTNSRINGRKNISLSYVEKNTDGTYSMFFKPGASECAFNGVFGLVIKSVTYYGAVSKAITDAGWATYCSPYALDFTSDITNLEAAYIVTGGDGGVLTTEEVTGTVAANTGLLLKGSKGTVTIPVVASGTDYTTTNKLVGVTASETLDANGGYVLMNEGGTVAFYKNNKDFTLGANTAYLPANFDGTGTAPFFLLDAETTGVSEELRVKSEAFATAVYNMQGQRVSQPTKGLYIVGGRKVMVK